MHRLMYWPENTLLTPRWVVEYSTRFVRVLCHPGDGDAPDLRVTEAEQEGPVGLGHQHVLGLLFIHKAQDRPV